MDDLATIISKLQTLLPHLREKYGVGGLWVFSSRAKGVATSSSDLDLLVEFERREISLFGFVGLEQQIGDYLGLKVDLVEREALRPEIGKKALSEAVAV